MDTLSETNPGEKITITPITLPSEGAAVQAILYQS